MKPNGNSSPPIGKTVPTPGCLPAKKTPAKPSLPALSRRHCCANRPSPAMNPAASALRAICSAKTPIPTFTNSRRKFPRRDNGTQTPANQNRCRARYCGKHLPDRCPRRPARGIGASGGKHEYTGGKRFVKSSGRAAATRRFPTRYPCARQTLAHHQKPLPPDGAALAHP